MTSDHNSPNVAHKTPADKKVIGGRATREQRVLIDMACAKLQEDRGAFMVKAALERAQKVMEAA